MLPLFSVLKDEPSMIGLSDIGYTRADAVAKLASFGRSFHDAYAAAHDAKAGWVDKSPRYAEDPEVLGQVFEDGRFVVMHRHPLDQVHSFTKGGWRGHPTLGECKAGWPLIQAAAQYWGRVTRNLIDFAARRPEATLTITYEDLCADPRSVLDVVLQHLDLPWFESVLEYHKFEHDLGREAGRVAGTVGFAASTGGWRRWPGDWSQEAWRIVSKVGAEIGYKAPE